jgi:arylformamidase
LFDVKEIVDLAHPLYNGMPNLGAGIVAFWPTETHEATQLHSGGRMKYEQRMMLLSEHCGTHVDAPYSWNPEGPTIDQVPLESLILPGYFCDFSSKRAREPITIDDFQRVAELKGEPVGPGSAVIAWAGTCDDWSRQDFATERPYVPTETAQWLVDQRITCFATDLIGIDDPDEWWWPTHVIFQNACIPMVQQLNNLDRLASKEFLFVVTPLAMRGGTGSPVRPVAIVV